MESSTVHYGRDRPIWQLKLVLAKRGSQSCWCPWRGLVLVLGCTREFTFEALPLDSRPATQSVKRLLCIREAGPSSFTVSSCWSCYITMWHPAVVVEVSDAFDRRFWRVTRLKFRAREKHEWFLPLRRSPPGANTNSIFCPPLVPVPARLVAFRVARGQQPFSWGETGRESKGIQEIARQRLPTLFPRDPFSPYFGCGSAALCLCASGVSNWPCPKSGTPPSHAGARADPARSLPWSLDRRTRRPFSPRTSNRLRPFAFRRTFQAERLVEELPLGGAAAKVTAAPDLWDLPAEFQTVLYPSPWAASGPSRST